MAPFICLCWNSGAVEKTREIDRFEAELLGGGGWRIAEGLPGCRVYGLLDRRLEIQVDAAGGSLLVGELFDSLGRPANFAAPADLDPVQAARRLLETRWGRYVAVWRDPSGEARAVLRDPCGTGDTATWVQTGIAIIATAMPEVLMRWFGPREGLDWRALHGLAADPFFGGPASPFCGIVALAAGGLAKLDGGRIGTEQTWRPARFVAAPFSDAQDGAVPLRDKVDQCVSALAGRSGPILAEVSGGFDSAIVADSLQRCGAPVAAWCNHFTPDRSGDERTYARAVGSRLGIEISFRQRPPAVITPTLIARSQFGLRPSVFALDPVYDDETIAAAKVCGAKRLFTGFGGDGLFYSIPNPGIAGDRLRRLGPAALFDRELAHLARWCRKSIWTVLRAAVAPPPTLAALPRPPWVSSLEAAGPETRHPWLEDTAGLSTAKRNHIEEQVLALLASGTSLRGQTLDIVHPLFSQPVLELCLSLPVDRLVEGGRDRALARRAFRDRIPALLDRRRSKGELGLYYGSAVAESLPSIRAFLMDGRLAAQNILRRDVLEQATEEAWLSQNGSFSSLLFAVAIEAWVRRWEPVAMARPR